MSSNKWCLHKFQFKALGGLNELQIVAPKVRDVSDLAKYARERVLEIEKKYSRYREDSVLSKINKSAGGVALEIDEETDNLLAYADQCFAISDGLFDITSGVLRRAWNFKDCIVPTAAMLAEVVPLIGWQKVERKPGSIRLPEKGMEIDFGGIGKEYAVDCVAKLLLDAGIESGLVNFAGDLRVLGPKADNTPWNVGIVDPRKKGGTVTSVALAKGALASSGDYERFFEVDGRRYCHILNPKTGWPVSDLRSVSVITESCLVAGSYSTIAMLKGESEGIQFLHNAKVKFCVVNREGRLIAS